MNRKAKQKLSSPVSKSPQRAEPGTRISPQRVEPGTRISPQRAEPGTRMSVLMANPDYLLEGFAEKRCQHIGVLDGIATSQDLNDRAFLLRNLDNSRNSGKLPWQLGMENNVSVTISAFNLKIIREDRSRSVLHRLPIHEIGCCCYVNDDDQHLLFVRAGESGSSHCPVHVFSLSRRADAEEICAILCEVFRLVYTEATLRQLNDSISAGERGSAVATGTRGTPSRGTSDMRRQLDLSEEREEGEGEREGEGEGEGQGEGEGEGEEGATAEELVQEYMTRLHKLLDFKELRQFASLLKQYRDSLPVREFLQQLTLLYGAQRSFLIPGMRSFIPEEDKGQFEAFLIQNSLAIDQSDRSAADTKPHPPRGPPVGRKKRGRGQGGVADVDKFLADIDTHAQAMLNTSEF